MGLKIKLIIFLIMNIFSSLALSEEFTIAKYQYGLTLVTDDFATFLSNSRGKNRLHKESEYIYQYDININFDKNSNAIIYNFVPQVVIKNNVFLVGGGSYLLV